MIQRQIQRAVLKGLNLTGNLKDGGKDIFKHIHYQADETDQSQYQTETGNPLHPHDCGVHLVGAVVIEGVAPVDHLIQLADQRAEVRLDRSLIIFLGLSWVGAHHLLYLGHRLMQLLVHGLDLVPQPQNFRIIRASLPINPLAQGALGIVGAWEFSPGIQGSAQVAGPLVMGGLSGLSLIQQGDSSRTFLLHLLNPEQIEGCDPAEQQDRQQRRGYPVKYHLLNTLTH